MEKVTLVSLMEADREMIAAAIERDRRPEAAQAALEKALDRLSLRYAEQCGDVPARESAQVAIRVMKGALPLMDSVGESRRWQRTVDAEAKRRIKPAAMGLLAVGAVLVLAVMLGLLITGGRLTGIVAFIEAIVPALLGMAALFLAGVRQGRPGKKREAPSEVREEFLVDGEKVLHHLRGMLLLADSAIDAARARQASERSSGEAMQEWQDSARIELFAGLLESCYAQDNADSREMIDSIRFYLHGRGVEVVDLAPGREGWFEFLPAQTPGTIRPALVQNDRLIKKGMAAV